METFGKICFTVIALIITTIIGGFVFSTLWSWLIVPTFAFQKLSIIQAIGISFFISYIKNNPMKKSEEEMNMEYITKALLTAFIYGAITLGLGWVIKLFH